LYKKQNNMFIPIFSSRSWRRTQNWKHIAPIAHVIQCYRDRYASIRLEVVLWGLLLLLLMFIPEGRAAKQSYRFSIVGRPADVVHAIPEAPSFVLMGGDANVDAAFKWMIKKSGGGNFVVIGADNSDEYNRYIYNMGGMASVETIIIPSVEAANDPFVIKRIRAADALFIVGGDQSDYINYWKSTPVHEAIQYLADRNVPIGGISAGLAVLGQHVFTGVNGSINSTAALTDPYQENVTLASDFLRLHNLDGVITDTHFDTRKRIGRLVSFMARIAKDNMIDTIRSIGVDTGTALLIDNDVAMRVGKPNGAVYFLNTNGLPEVCEPQTPLSYSNIRIQRLEANERFDMRQWAKINTRSGIYSVSVRNGKLEQLTQFADVNATENAEN
jgi:cyanophycinase